MSCNGCRVLRKGCSESCILRPCLQWIESPEAQGHATVFVAKFFGRAGLMSFISAVPEIQRPALFQSLLFEACGRTVNPVNGAVGLLWTGNWHLCQAAVETVLRGGALRPLPGVLDGSPTPDSDEGSEAEVACTDMWKLRGQLPYSRSRASKRKSPDDVGPAERAHLDLSLMSGLTNKVKSAGLETISRPEKRRPATPSMNSEESVTTSLESGPGDHDTRGGGEGGEGERKLLKLFV